MRPGYVVLKAWSAFSLKASRLNQDQTGLALKYTIPLRERSCTMVAPIKHRPDRVKFIAKERDRREITGFGWYPLDQSQTRIDSLPFVSNSVYDEMTYPVSPTAVIKLQKEKKPRGARAGGSPAGLNRPQMPVKIPWQNIISIPSCVLHQRQQRILIAQDRFAWRI